MNSRAAPTRLIGHAIRTFDELPSTNDLALELAADPAHAGLVVVAGQQSAGRGQHGRVWQSPAGAALLCSVVVPATPALRRPAILTAWAAVAVAETVERFTGFAARIKWPNDVLVEGKKVCGILIEQTRGTVAGIGLNVNTTADNFRAAGLPDAVSLHMLTGRAFQVEDVLNVLLDRLDCAFIALAAGDCGGLLSPWVARLGLVGTSARAELTDGTAVEGIVQSLDFEAVVLVPAAGPTVRLVPESLRGLRPLTN